MTGNREVVGLREVHIALTLRPLHQLVPPLQAKCSLGQGMRPPTKALSLEKVPSIRHCLEMPCSVQQTFIEHLLYMEVDTEASKIQACLKKIDLR